MMTETYEHDFERFYDEFELPEWVIEIFKERTGIDKAPALTIRASLSGWHSSGSFEECSDGKHEFSDAGLEFSLEDGTIYDLPDCPDFQDILAHFEDDIVLDAMEKNLR